MKNSRSLLLALLMAAIPAALAQTPTVTTVVEAAGQTPPGFPNYGIPPGGILKITGGNLGPVAAVNNFPSFALGTALGDVSVRVRSGQTDYAALMTSAQAATVFAILPSEVPLGNATLTLTYAGRTSAAFNIRVADIAGIFTLNARSAGPALVLNSKFEPVTLLNPARPGETVMLVLNARVPPAAAGTAAIADETDAELEKIQRVMQGDYEAGRGDRAVSPPFGDLYIQDRPIETILFGRLLGGLAYLLFQVPPVVTNACWHSLYFRNATNIRSNVATFSVADSAQSICVDPIGPGLKEIFAKAKPGPFPFSLEGFFYRIDFKRDFGGISGGGEFLIAKTFYEEGPFDYQDYKDSFQTTYGCYSETFFRPRPPNFPNAAFINLGPQIQLMRGTIIERINRGTSGSYSVSSFTNVLSPFGPILVDIPGIPGTIPGYRPEFTFPFSLPTTPLQASVTGNAINVTDDLRIRLTGIPPNRTDHHIMVTLNIPLLNLNAGVNTICKFPSASEVVIPNAFLRMMPDSGTNAVNLTVIYQPNRPYAPNGALPDRIGYADVADRIYSTVNGLSVRNTTAQ